MPRELLLAATDAVLSVPDVRYKLTSVQAEKDLAYVLAGPEIGPEDVLDTADPTPAQFHAVSRELSHDAQVSLAWRRMARRKTLPATKGRLLATLVASRWSYLLLNSVGLLGAHQQGSWGNRDTTHAYRTVFGRFVADDHQDLWTRTPPPGVLRRFATSLEDEVLKGLIPAKDEELLRILRPAATSFTPDLVGGFTEHARQTPT